MRSVLPAAAEGSVIQLDSFNDVLEKVRSLHAQKGKDYDGKQQYSNYRRAEEFGIPAWVGAMLRANEKMNRIQTYARTRELVNESVEDSFLDIMVCAGIAYLLWQEEQVK